MLGKSGRASHAIGPRGWFAAQGTAADSLHQALRASGAIRRIPVDVDAAVKEAYADPLRNRSFAFLDAVFGPTAALVAERRLREATVGIVGCGGIGSGVAYLLAGMGTRRFLLVDPDVVEEGNLARQVMYTLNDLGRPKVEVIAEALTARFRGIEASGLQVGGLSGVAVNRLAQCNYVVCAGDDPPTLGSELRKLLPYQVPLWTCGYTIGRSIVRNPDATIKSDRGPIVSWQSLYGGFAPSSGLQNLEIAAACVWGITVFCADVRRVRGRSDDSMYFHDYTGWKSRRS